MPGWEVEQPKALKQRHLYGNVGVITNPQPSSTNFTDFLVPVAVHAPDFEGAYKLYRPEATRDRKLLEQSSEMFDKPRHLVPSTLSPRQEIRDVGHANFPYNDTSLDEYVPKKPIARAVDGTPPVPSSTPRAPRPCVKFEPPTRPGAAFRRRTEKNFSDLFDYEAPPAGDLRSRHDVTEMASIDFQDTRLEVAWRGGNRFPRRMRSAPELPGTADVRT